MATTDHCRPRTVPWWRTSQSPARRANPSPCQAISAMVMPCPAVSFRHQNRPGRVGMEVVEKFVFSRIEGAEHDECSALRGEHLLAVKLDALELGGRGAGIVQLDLERAASRHLEAQRRDHPVL